LQYEEAEKMVKAILFDLYLTLIDLSEAKVEHLHKAAWKTLANFGCQVNYDRLVEVIESVYGKWRDYRIRNLVEVNPRLWWFEILDKLKIRTNLKKVEEIVQSRHRAFRERIKLYNDVEETLILLRQNPWYLGIISNSSDGVFARDDIRHLGIDSYFDLAVISADLNSRKPDTRIFRKTLGLLDLEPKDAVFIGDDLVADIKGAKEAGMLTVYLNRFNHENYLKVEPDFQITNLNQLERVLAGL